MLICDQTEITEHILTLELPMLDIFNMEIMEASFVYHSAILYLLTSPYLVIKG